MEDKILKKIEEYKKHKESLVSQVWAINGAIQALEKLLEKEEPKDATDHPKTGS